MSSDLETMYEDLMFNSIPRLWKSVSYDSLKSLAAYEVDLQNRVNFMREWLIHGRPANFPLYLFFFPQGFLTGVLQNHARQYMVPIDALDFSYRMIDNTKVAQRRNGPKVGVFIHGLWMEGARLDDVDCTLKESRPGEMFQPCQLFISFQHETIPLRQKNIYALCIRLPCVQVNCQLLEFRLIL